MYISIYLCPGVVVDTVVFLSYALSCEIEGLGDSSPTSPKPRKSMVKRLSL